MQLKLKRSQREGGLTGGTAIFCLDARADLSADEQQSVSRYKLGNQVIYNSEGAKQAAASSAVSAHNAKTRGISVKNADEFLFSATDTIGHGLKAAALSALAAMRLNVTITSLQKGHHIECKSLDELLGAEEGIMAACRNLAGYLETAASFDGREVVIDFSAPGEPVVASAVPSPQRIAQPVLSHSTPHAAAPQPASISYAPAAPSYPSAATVPSTNISVGIADIIASLTALEKHEKCGVLLLAALLITMLCGLFHFPALLIVLTDLAGTALIARVIKLF